MHRPTSLALALLLPLQALAATVTLGITPADTMLAPGGRGFVDIVGSHDGADKLLGGAFSLHFRADLLQVLDVSLKAPSDVAGSTGSVVLNGSEGLLSGVGFASFSGVTGSFTLARIEFQAIGAPGSVGALQVVDGADPVYAWANESFEAVDVLGGVGSISISAVPEVPAACLLLAGLACVAARRPRQTSA